MSKQLGAGRAVWVETVARAAIHGFAVNNYRPAAMWSRQARNGLAMLKRLRRSNCRRGSRRAFRRVLICSNRLHVSAEEAYEPWTGVSQVSGEASDDAVDRQIMRRRVVTEAKRVVQVIGRDSSSCYVWSITYYKKGLAPTSSFPFPSPSLTILPLPSL